MTKAACSPMITGGCTSNSNQEGRIVGRTESRTREGHCTAHHERRKPQSWQGHEKQGKGGDMGGMKS